MIRGTFVIRDGQLIPKHEAPPLVSAERMSAFPCPRIAGDVMDPVQSMLDGKMYDSKSALRRTYRSAGMIEVGNDPARLRPRERQKADRRKIRDVVERATARFNRGERVSRVPVEA